MLWLGLGIFLRLLVIAPPRGLQFLDPANASGGRNTKLDRAGASILEHRGKLAVGGDAGARLAIELPVCNFIVYGGAVVGIPFDIAGREVSIPLWVVGGCLVMGAYLMRPDETLRQTTLWMRENVPYGDLVIIKAYSVYAWKYPQLPGFSYLSGRRNWIWSPYLCDEERARALKTSRWIVETLPPSKTSWWENVRKQIKGHERPVEDISRLKKIEGS